MSILATIPTTSELRGASKPSKGNELPAIAKEEQANGHHGVHTAEKDNPPESGAYSHADGESFGRERRLVEAVVRAREVEQRSRLLDVTLALPPDDKSGRPPGTPSSRLRGSSSAWPL
jgi:hypothetical protein